MKESKAYIFSVILVGSGVIFMSISLFDVFPEQNEALLFAGVISFFSGIFMKFIVH
jgi:hypothetical protein